MIKKYVITVLLVFASLAGISFYYIKSATTLSKFPDYYLKKESGDEKSVKNLVLNGTLNGTQFSEDVQITSESSEYYRKLSLFQKIDELRGMPRLQALTHRYKNFMRGKTAFNGIYEDEKWVVTAQVRSERKENKPIPMEISILNKDEKSSLAFSISLPKDKKEPFYDVYVADVQRFQNTINVLTNNISDKSDSFHLYSFSIQDKTLIKDTKLLEDERSSISFSYAKETNPYASSQYEVISAKGRDIVSKNKETQKSKLRTKYFVLDLYSGTTKEISLPKGMSEKATLFEENTSLYFCEVGENKVRVAAYNLESNTIESDQSFPRSDIFTINKGKIYIANNGLNDYNPIHLSVFDLSSGENIYKGTYIPKTHPVQKGKYLYASDLTVL